MANDFSYFLAQGSIQYLHKEGVGNKDIIKTKLKWLSTGTLVLQQIWKDKTYCLKFCTSAENILQ